MCYMQHSLHAYTDGNIQQLPGKMAPRITIYAGDSLNGSNPRATKDRQHPGYLQGMRNKLELIELRFHTSSASLPPK
uniref:Uncharacterized protein n=1 Tax=Arundo donax TaxID=35708 RepID=A0A0A8YTD5_ARUDO